MRDLMPTAGEYAGVAIHSFQDEARIRDVVVPHVDSVLSIETDAALLSIVGDVTRAPEARILAARRLLQPAEAREAQRRRQQVDAAFVRASVAGLDKLAKAHPHFYCSIYDVWAPDAPWPDRRPPEAAEALRLAQAAARCA